MSLKKQKINFTQVQNELLVRSDIDFGLKGLFAYIMSKPDGWEFSSYRIAQETKESDRTIKTMINKLIKLGYLIRTKHSTGKITYETFLYPECKKATVKNLHGDKSSPLSNTDKKSNTEKEEKIEKEIPAYIEKELWIDFLDVRKKLKAPNTDRAIKGLLKKLDQFEKTLPGSANTSIDESIMNGWKGVFAPKKQGQQKLVFPWPNLEVVENDAFPNGMLYVDKDKGLVYETSGKKSDLYDWDKGLGCITA